MKKLFCLLLALPLLLASCSNDDDLPNVNFNVNCEGGTQVDGVIYVVKGEKLSFTSLGVTAVNPEHKAAIVSATYYWDFLNAGTTIVEPFAASFDTSLYSEGIHEVQIVCPIVEVDCTPATAVLAFRIMIVPSADDIPDGGTTVGIVPQVSIQD